MSLYPQQLLDVHDERVIDLFAGGGGASSGIEMATGRQVDVAANHDPAAVALHQANHPQTEHLTADVFEVDPHEAADGRPVGLLWASPDCTYYSKARGGKPIRSKHRKRRALAWVVTRWAGQVKPRVIILENVEEFTDWGPLIARRCPKTGRVKKVSGGVAAPGERVPLEDQELVPCPRRAKKRFQAWVRSLRSHGYDVEWRELRASDYGAPTIRKRLFLVARCDGRSIVWPEPTHGTGKGLRPFRTAAEIIDWSVPMLSIFASPDEAKAWARAWRKAGLKMGTPRRPLADATLRRIARGVQRYVLEAAEPFVVSLAHGDSGGRREYPVRAPLGTQHSGGGKFALAAPYLVPNNTNNAPKDVRDPAPTVTGGGRNILAAPYLIPRYGERKGQEPRTRSIQRPHPVVVPTGNGAQLVSAFMARHYGGMVGKDLRDPWPTILTKGAQDQIAAVHLQRDFGASVGSGAGEPVGTLTAGGGGKAAVVASFLQAYYGEGTGQGVDEPLRTATTKDRLGLVTVTVDGQEWVVVDIAMRMLQPHELYRAQGFPDSYQIDVEFHDEEKERRRRLTKTEQVRMVGNSVSPPQAAALVRANCPELVARDEAREAVA